MSDLRMIRPLFCRTPAGDERTGNGTTAVENPEEEVRAESEKAILCRRCLRKVTSPGERIRVDDSHHHTFANPHGIVFEIGCFRTAEGCGQAGPSSGEFTWFKGFVWRIAFCRGCLNHLGWVFLSDHGGGSFYGLILDRLIDSD
jgi:hypothetical protein